MPGSGKISREATLDAVLYTLMGILEKLPQCDVLDRQIVNVATGSVAVSSGTITTVTTVSTVSNIASIGGAPANLLPYQLGAGAFHIYNGIHVS